MPSNSDDINYAKLLGFESAVAAAIFAALYVPFFAWFVRQSLKGPTYVLVMLSVFCATRITAFVIRALLAGSDSIGHNLSLLISDEILFGVGFFGLLSSAYILVLDRMLLFHCPKPTGVTRALTIMVTNRRLFRIVMTVAVALGITGVSLSQSSSPDIVGLGKAFRLGSTITFLHLTVLQTCQTLKLARVERSSGAYRHDNESWGMKNGSYILCAVSLLLLIREIFVTAVTINDTDIQNNEHLWYPLLALPEILAVAFHATPGLVPPRSELPM
ncbi:hypothetical protein BD779DRAFT_1456166 [Infundibulicybe gibba]|nr:hypothetical protein BD779DRAFT_1456166 [Infundibulicybe gibba]